MALLDAHGFTEADFARSHPGGTLGRRLLTRISDVMHQGAEIPAVPETASLSAALREMTRARLGMTAVVDAGGRVLGIFTDGDLRRAHERITDFRDACVRDVMTAGPLTLRPDALAVEAIELMERRKVNQLLVVDAGGALVGALNMHDLFRAKVI